jgi:hypothetical protein
LLLLLSLRAEGNAKDKFGGTTGGATGASSGGDSGITDAALLGQWKLEKLDVECIFPVTKIQSDQ